MAIPEEVRRLVGDHITSVEQLEVLLLLERNPAKEWTPLVVSEEIRTSESSAAGRLQDLAARGFLEEQDGPRRYRYAPHSAALRPPVSALAREYAEKRHSIIDLIFSKPIDNLRAYADAFRYKKEEPDG